VYPEAAIGSIHWQHMDSRQLTIGRRGRGRRPSSFLVGWLDKTLPPKPKPKIKTTLHHFGTRQCAIKQEK